MENSVPENGHFDGFNRLACPFHKRNPELYEKSRSCNGAGFLDLSRLKEHLKNVHGFKCPKACGFVFNGHTSSQHGEQSPACKYQRSETIEHLTEAQWNEIDHLPRRCRGAPPGDQWKLFYRKMFGDDAQVPAPYLPSLEQYRQVAQKPPGEFLEALRIKMTASLEQPFAGVIDHHFLRFCLAIVPTLFELVSENGVLPDNTIPLPAPGQQPNHDIYQFLLQFGVLAVCPECNTVHGVGERDQVFMDLVNPDV